MTEHNILKKAAYWTAVFLCILIIGGTTAAFGYQPVEATKNGYAEISGKDNISKILAVLETSNSDRKVLDRAAEKLLTLQGEELRLMSSLCDRISLNNDTAGTEIAFSLIMAMIVLS